MKVLIYKYKETKYVTFKCPGCKTFHQLPVSQINDRFNWGFNDDGQNPTITPSILAKSGHFVDGKTPCWCTYAKEHPEDNNAPICYVCHSFVTDGKIQFLGDCTHELANQTVELPEIDGAPWLDNYKNPYCEILNFPKED